MRPTTFVLIISIMMVCPFALGMGIQSPDGNITVDISVIDGALKYGMVYQGKKVILPSKLGIVLGSAPFQGGFNLEDAKTDRQDLTWEPAWGKTSRIVDQHNSLKLLLREKGPLKRRMDMEFRAYNDGVGFRYVFPEQNKLKQFTVTRDETEFIFGGDYTVWSPQGEHANIGPVPLSKFKGKQIPLTVKVDDRCYLAVHEAAVYDFCNFVLERKGERAFGANMGASKVSAPIHTSWRAIIVGRSPGDLLLSNVLVNLNPPCAIENPSWIKTGVAMWDWRGWGAKTADGFTYGLDMPSWKRHIDFGAKHGLRYLLLDANWYGPEFKPESNPMTPREGVDIKGLIRYGRERGIGIMLYINDVARKNYDFEKTLALYHEWGAAGIKYGFMREKGQKKVLTTREIIRLCAKYQLTVDFHDGPIPPSGDRRTWPNCLTREYCHAQSDAKRAFVPKTFVTTVFVNMLSGPLDMNNGLYDLKNPTKDRPKIFMNVPSTVVAETARIGITFSGLAILPDIGEAYEKKTDLFEFIGKLPMNWDEIRIIHGRIGKHITTARRSDAEWFVASAINEEGGTLKIPLDFLGKGTFDVMLYEDAPDSHYQNNREAYRVRTDKVTARDTITARLAPGGGHCMWIQPAAD